MKRDSKKKVKTLWMILLLFGIPISLLYIFNREPPKTIPTQIVEGFKAHTENFTLSHRNPSNKLFLETDFDSNYRAVDSVDWSNNLGIYGEQIVIDPRNNPYMPADKSEFFYYYLYEKQNEDGGYSDIAGSSNILSTFEMMETIDILNNTWINQTEIYNQEKNTKIAEFTNSCLGKDGWGFKFSPISSPDLSSIFPEFSFISGAINDSYPDIISTYMGIKLAQRFDESRVLIEYYNEICSFINSTKFGGYTLTNNSLFEVDPQSTYYGIRAFQEMNMTYNATSLSYLLLYLGSLYNNTDGGYAAFPGNSSDAVSTYYVIASYTTLGIPLDHAQENYDFLKTCQKLDGGFGFQPDPQIASDFMSGWAAFNAIQILLQNGSLIFDVNENNQMRINYHKWIYEHQATNGLFGTITVESNYWGVNTVTESDPNGIFMGSESKVYIENTIEFLYSCYNKETGGYGSVPGANASLFTTYCALNIFQTLYRFNKTYGPNASKTIEYIASMQNNDGGFKIGNDINFLLSFYGGYLSGYATMLQELLNQNQSTTESTYWAIKSLSIVRALNNSVINMNNLTSWLKSSQNADGGFGIFIGFHSDLASTYHGIKALDVINKPILSKMAIIEFLKMAQMDDGSFSIIPALASFADLNSLMLVTYMGVISLYDYRSVPNDIRGLIDWCITCISEYTHGIGDAPYFGGDLHNSYYALLLIEEIRYDQSFDPTPWNQILGTIMALEIIFIIIFVFLKLITLLGSKIFKRLSARFGFGEKLNIQYLQRFPAIKVENLAVYAGGKAIISNISLKIEHGEIFGVLGESGAGKSTFVKALLGMRETTGINEIYGMDVSKNATKFRPLYGYVPQDLSKVYLDFTVMENLQYFGRQYGLTEKEINTRGKKILRSLEIQNKAGELVKNLSGGQKRRVSIAIALIHNPVLCILDEPTSGLDPVVRENLWICLTEINEQFNTTLIVITHYPEESRFCNKVAIFGRKRGMIDFGNPRELLNALPGRGRTIQVEFKDIQKDAVKILEKIEGIDKALEIKLGTDYSIYSDLSISEIREKIELNNAFGQGSIANIYQQDSKMEELFRYRAMEVPKFE